MFEQIAEKMRVLRGVIQSVEKQFGKGSVMTLSDEEAPEPVATIPTGSLALDVATGIGGYPRGRVVEMYGPESSGKTTLALHAIAEAQRSGGVAAFIDAEHALDIGYARNVGVLTEKLLISQPDTGEQALDITEMLVRLAQSIWWSSTPWLRSRPRPNSRARWEIPTWVCKRA